MTSAYLSNLVTEGFASVSGNVYTLTTDYVVGNSVSYLDGPLVIAKALVDSSPSTLIIPFGKTISFSDIGPTFSQVIDIPFGNTLVNQGGTITPNTVGNKIQLTGTFINMGKYTILQGIVAPSQLEMYGISAVINSCGGVMDGISIIFKGNDSSLTNEKNGSITSTKFSNDRGATGVTIINKGNLSFDGISSIDDIGVITNYGLITVSNILNSSAFNTNTQITNYGKFAVELTCSLSIRLFVNDNTISVQNGDLPYDEGGNGPSFIIDDINTLLDINGNGSATFTNMSNTLIVNQTDSDYTIPNKVTIDNQTGGLLIPLFQI